MAFLYTGSLAYKRCNTCELRRLCMHPTSVHVTLSAVLGWLGASARLTSLFSRQGCLGRSENTHVLLDRPTSNTYVIHMSFAWLVRPEGREGPSVPCSEAQRKLVAAGQGSTLWIRTVASEPKGSHGCDCAAIDRTLFLLVRSSKVQ